MKFESIKQQIEKTPKIAELEAHYYKNPRENLKESMFDRKPESVQHYISNKERMTVHTHPNYLKPSMPSLQDLATFNRESTNVMVIAATTHEGKVSGYTFINKHQTKIPGKNLIIDNADFAKEKIIYEQVEEEMKLVRDQIEKLKSVPTSTTGQINEQYIKWQNLSSKRTNMIMVFVEKCNWRIRFVPMKGYQFRNGYYIPKPPPDKDGGKVPNSNDPNQEALRKRKEEELKRLRRLNSPQKLRN